MVDCQQPKQGREVWSFFSGAMGLDIGFEQAGLGPTLVNEIDKDCIRTIRANRPDLDLVDTSITDLNGSLLREHRNYYGEVFMMIGGPPCQSFSSGGKRTSLGDPRGNLIYEYFRLISEVKPLHFVLENVANLTTAALRHRPIAKRPGKNWNLKSYSSQRRSRGGEADQLAADELSGSAIKQILRDVRRLDYRVTFGVLDSADYGAPQHRLRFIMAASRDSQAPSLPLATHGDSRFGLEPFQTVRSAIHCMLNDPGIGSEYTDEVKRYFEYVPTGGNWRDLPLELQPEALGGAWSSGGGKTGFYRRLSWDAPSPTVTGRANRKGSAMCHPEQHRPISVRESAALQGFPSEWTFVGSMNSQYQQIGNAVPVHLARAVARTFDQREGASEPSPRNEPTYDEMLEIAVARLRTSARNRRKPRKGLAA